MKKLTKQEISEAIQSIPIERLLLGNNKDVRLTKKQKTFAEELVKTGNKTEAYRRAYDTDGTPRTQGRDAIKVSQHPIVATYVQALESAKAVEEYVLPKRLRSMAIQKLSQMALNDELPPSQQLRALELVGKMTEVALFSERRELVHTLDSNALKEQLMNAVQSAISNSSSIQAKNKRTANDLLRELNEEIIDVEEIPDVTNVTSEQGFEGDAMDSTKDIPISCADGSAENPDMGEPTGGHDHFSDGHSSGLLHSISHTQS
jgi:phage terminase small subunit